MKPTVEMSGCLSALLGSLDRTCELLAMMNSETGLADKSKVPWTVWCKGQQNDVFKLSKVYDDAGPPQPTHLIVPESARQVNSG